MSHQPPYPPYGQQYPPQFPPLYPQFPPPKPKSWPARHKWLTALIVFVALAIIGGIQNAIDPTKPKAAADSSPAPVATTASATPSPARSLAATVKASPAAAVASAKPKPPASTRPSVAASPSCLTLVRSWIAGGSSRQLGAVQSDLTSMDGATKQFAGDAENDYVPPSDVSAVQNAAANLQADAQALESNPAPECVPGMRADVSQAATDHQKVAIDAGDAMGQYSAGAYSASIADIQAATGEMSDGTDQITAATAAAQSLSG
jgi:hypothetical protein